MTLGERLRELRLARGYSVAKLAKKSGVHAVQIRYYELGTRCPGVDNLRKLCIALERTLGAFHDVEPYHKKKMKCIYSFRDFMAKLTGKTLEELKED